MAQPNPLYGRLTVLLACADEQIAQTTLGPVCQAFITESPGDDPALDLGDCCPCSSGHGYLVGWWTRMYPSTSFPVETDDPRSRCGVAYGFEVAFRISRCATQMDENDGTVDPDALAVSAERQLEDAYTLLRALRCCAGDDAVLSEVTPFAEGTCIGSVVRLILRFETPELVAP